jgi:hypothetical protein
VDWTRVAGTCTVGVAGCSIVGVTSGGVEAVLVHPPARTNPITHTMKIRMGSFIQGTYCCDIINVFEKSVL